MMDWPQGHLELARGEQVARLRPLLSTPVGREDVERRLPQEEKGLLERKLRKRGCAGSSISLETAVNMPGANQKTTPVLDDRPTRMRVVDCEFVSPLAVGPFYFEVSYSLRCIATRRLLRPQPGYT